MQTSVNLQPPFSYSIYPIIVIIVILAGIGIYLLLTRRKNPVVQEEMQIKEIEPKDLNHIKHKYIKRINIIEERLMKNKITVRAAYQGLSTIIRYFVYEVTNIKVQNCTLKDIEKLKMPVLSQLIQEYYAPEFAEKSIGNIKASLEKTRKVIEKWN